MNYSQVSELCVDLSDTQKSFGIQTGQRHHRHFINSLKVDLIFFLSKEFLLGMRFESFLPAHIIQATSYYAMVLKKENTCVLV